MNADNIWQYLDMNGECSAKELKRQLKISDVDLNLALGWLAFEKKVVFFEKDGLQIANLYF